VSWGWLEGRADEVPAGDAWLAEAERGLLGPGATAPRRADWRLGRWTAKRALAAWLGLPAGVETWSALAVVPAPDGAPVPRYRGQPLRVSLSLSHRAGWSIAAVGAPGIEVGCDVERIEPRSAGFVDDYLTGSERALWVAQQGGDRDALVNRIWSAKESVLKLARRGLRVDPREVEIRFSPAGPSQGWRAFSAHWAPLGDCRGWWRSQDERIFTLVSHPELAPPRPL
jgi:4'-phosphopantetheinyl transferase